MEFSDIDEIDSQGFELKGKKLAAFSEQIKV
jgi:hypothetical protein